MSETEARHAEEARDADEDRSGDVPAPSAAELEGSRRGGEEPILEVDHLVKHFPIKAGILFDRADRRGPGGRRRLVHDRARRDARAGRRVRLRQVDPRAARSCS